SKWQYGSHKRKERLSKIPFQLACSREDSVDVHDEQKPVNPARIGDRQRQIKDILERHGNPQQDQEREPFQETDPFESSGPFGLFGVHFLGERLKRTCREVQSFTFRFLSSEISLSESAKRYSVSFSEYTS